MSAVAATSTRFKSKLARPGEILVSEAVRKQIEGVGNFRFVDERLVTLKGISGEHRLVAVGWR